MASESTTLYLKADRNVEVSQQNVMLGDLLNMECSDKTILMKVKTLRILKIREEKEQRYVISVLKIIACIHEQYPRIFKIRKVFTFIRMVLSEHSILRRSPNMMFCFDTSTFLSALR